MNDERLLVACLCAQWCGVCREYETVFAEVAREHAAAAIWIWVDIEDHEAVIDGVDVDDFPTLLIAGADDSVLFFGPLGPQRQMLVRLLQAAIGGALSPRAAAPLIGALPARVRRLAD
jgi:thiol-disulfide isomerase/thioredoxin